MSQLIAFLLLPRPLNGLITALSVGVGLWTANAPPTWGPGLIAALSAALINGAGNAFNDLIDIDIDRINRPDRPLPSGRISPFVAGVQTLALTLAGCLLGFWLSPWHGSIALGVALLLALYSIFLKNSLLWGNILVAFVGALAFPYGALAAGDLGRSWIPALFALLFHIGREIVKDIEDVAGDRLRGDHTLPLRWGRNRAGWIAAAVYLLLLAIAWIPFFTGLYGAAYALALAPVNGLVIYVLVQLYSRHAHPDNPAKIAAGRNDHRLGRLLKIGMFLGLLAVVLGELGFD
ncbi:UbiA family prenyltransferase [bacterium]|nr:UbiA family prenyltransferase [bacterium]